MYKKLSIYQVKISHIVISLSDPNQDQEHAKIGIEVKPQEHKIGKTLGGSIYESTRVPGRHYYCFLPNS